MPRQERLDTLRISAVPNLSTAPLAAVPIYSIIFVPLLIVCYCRSHGWISRFISEWCPMFSPATRNALVDQRAPGPIGSVGFALCGVAMLRRVFSGSREGPGGVEEMVGETWRNRAKSVMDQMLPITHRIHVWYILRVYCMVYWGYIGIYWGYIYIYIGSNIGGILMVNVIIYGSTMDPMGKIA